MRLPAESNHPLQVRLCHFCLHLNEANEEIFQCLSCQRSLSSEFYFAHEESESEPEVKEEEMTLNRRRMPQVTGLCVRW
jgi:hypothetical protein